MAVVLLISLPPDAERARAALVDRLVLLEARGEGHLVFFGIDGATETTVAAVRIHRDAQVAEIADGLARSAQDAGGTIRRVDLVEDTSLAAAGALFP